MNLFGRTAFTLQIYFSRDGYQIKKIVWHKSTACLWLGSLESILWLKCTSAHLKSLPRIAISPFFKSNWSDRIQSRPDTEAGACLFLICRSWLSSMQSKFGPLKVLALFSNSPVSLRMKPLPSVTITFFCCHRWTQFLFWMLSIFYLSVSAKKKFHHLKQILSLELKDTVPLELHWT